MVKDNILEKIIQLLYVTIYMGRQKIKFQLPVKSFTTQWLTIRFPRHCELHGRTGRNKLGGRKEICPTFSDCARKLFVKQINFGDLPPPGPTKFFGTSNTFSIHH